MTKLNKLVLAGGMAVLMSLGVSDVLAQAGGGGGQGGGGRGGPGGRGNFDPAQWIERYKERLEITDDTEWKAIQPLVQKVSEARMATMRGMFGRGRGGPGGGPGGQDNANPEQEALQKAVDSKASAADVKAALAKFVESRKQKQAALEKAQADLRKVLTPRQEAIATLYGLL